MAVSWLWLAALLSMGLLFPQVSRGDEELSPDNMPLVKRQSCNYGYILCGTQCCNTSGVTPYCFSTALGIWGCTTASDPCAAHCASSSCSITSYRASCVVDNTSPTSYRSATTSSDPYGYYGASSTTEEGSYETEHHRSSSSSSKSTEEKSKKLPPKAISGIVIGVVAFFSAIGAAFTWLFRRRKQRSAAPGPSAYAVPAEEHPGSPQYFKQPEPQVSPVSEPIPNSAPQRY